MSVMEAIGKVSALDRHYPAEYEHGWVCDGCGEDGQEKRWCCRECVQDFCFDCFPECTRNM